MGGKLFLNHLGRVGKTSLLFAFLDKKFSPQYRATIGAYFYIRDMEINENPIAIQVLFI